MGRRLGVVKLGGRNASDEVLAVLDVEVFMLGVFVFREQLPAEQITVELAGARWIGGAQVSPATSSIHVGNSSALVLVRLPHAKDGSRRILQHRHPARFANIESVLQPSPANLAGAVGRIVRAGDRDI